MKLGALAAPPSDYNHEDKGDALHAMEVTFALEKVSHCPACSSCQ